MAATGSRDQTTGSYVAGLCAVIERTAAEAGRLGAAADAITALRRGLEGDLGGNAPAGAGGPAEAASARLIGLGSGHVPPPPGEGLTPAQCEAETLDATAQFIGSIADRATAAALPDEKLAPVGRMTLGIVAQRGSYGDVSAALAAIGIDATPAAIASRLRKLMRERDPKLQ